MFSLLWHLPRGILMCCLGDIAAATILVLAAAFSSTLKPPLSALDTSLVMTSCMLCWSWVIKDQSSHPNVGRDFLYVVIFCLDCFYVFVYFYPYFGKLSNLTNIFSKRELQPPDPIRTHDIPFCYWLSLPNVASLVYIMHFVCHSRRIPINYQGLLLALRFSILKKKTAFTQHSERLHFAPPPRVFYTALPCALALLPASLGQLGGWFWSSRSFFVVMGSVDK